jgi:hypothetical protein
MAVTAALRGVLEFVIVGAVNVKTVTRHGGFLSKKKRHFVMRLNSSKPA